ncbi:MAG: hypothetical protein HOQ24_15530 [Mycobacteriaceae bacterium]|nr:hypothetical protein [Mycobacteriaceae bacterium]
MQTDRRTGFWIAWTLLGACGLVVAVILWLTAGVDVETECYGFQDPVFLRPCHPSFWRVYGAYLAPAGWLAAAVVSVAVARVGDRRGWPQQAGLLAGAAVFLPCVIAVFAIM